MGAVGSLPHRGQPLGDSMRQQNREGHPLAGLVAGVAEHHSLVARTLLVAAGFVDALGDVL